jgi:hypothetical protein
MRQAILCLTLLVAAVAARADSWAGPQAESVFSQDGSRFVRVTPGQRDGARAEFYARTPDRSYRRVADVTLLNPVAPVKMIMTNAGYLIAMDNWHNAGYGEVLAVYGPDGKVIKSHRLEDLYDKEGIATVPTSVSSRWWRCNPVGFVDPDQETEVYIGEFRGGFFRVKVATGLVSYEPGNATCGR